MASAYASLVSLVHVLIRVKHPTCPASFDQQQIQSLLDKTNSLVDFLEAYSQEISEDLGRKMVHVAYAAEDTIELYVSDQILEESDGDAYDVLCQDLERAIQEMDLIVHEVMQVKEENKGKHQLPLRYLHVDLPVATSGMVKMVGFDDEVTRVVGQLTAGLSSRQIIHVVGMGGIGKTTLATNAYNHPRLTHYFDVKAWVTVSQDFTVGSIIRPLLHDLGVSGADGISDNLIGDLLYKCLYSRKYLVILDDIWDAKAWDAINRFLPDNNNKSRIVVTTRISDVGRIVGSCCPIDMKLLDHERSWDLLSKTVFGEKACPHELEECGKKISKSCNGLPLAIVVIGGLLKTCRMTNEYWEYIAVNISSIIRREDGNRCLKILSLSYHQLPIYLKPCFLYLATYPHDYEIRVSQLIKLWAADGFLRPIVGDVTLEEIALNYLKELSNKNLITIREINSEGGMECFTVHDMVMDFCMTEVQREGFLHVDYAGENFPGKIESERRLAIHCSNYGSMPPKGLYRSFISFSKWASNYISQFRLLRSCILCRKERSGSLAQLVNLRLIEFSVDGTIGNWFEKIYLMWNLETLIISKFSAGYALTPSIWNLRNIKHLIFSERVILPDPPTFDADSVLQNLQTLDGVQVLNDSVLDMIPNIKKMDIHYVHHMDAELLHGFGNLARCQKLEILFLSLRHCRDLITIKFPPSIRKLTLYSCSIPWEKCGVGLLPNLETFTLEHVYFDDRKWNTVDGEFQKLKTLSLKACYLKSWTVEECCHFPSLERLIIDGERYLDGISQVFGESMTLELIKLLDCSYDVVCSAKRILDEQQSQGNYDLTVIVNECAYDSRYTEEVRADLLSMETENFHITF